MNTTKIIAALLGALSLSAGESPLGAQAHAFEGAVTLRIRQMPSDIQAQVKGAKARMEMQGPMGLMVVIIDSAVPETYLIVPAQQMVMVMKNAAMAQMVDSLARSAGADPADATVTATGKTETVAGHECEVHRYRSSKSVFDLCIARGLGYLGAGGLFANPMGGMGMGRGGMGGGQPGTGMDWRSLVGDRGFALRMADSVGVAIWEITKIEPKAVADSLFVVPANYQRMDMPGFGRRPPQ